MIDCGPSGVTTNHFFTDSSPPSFRRGCRWYLVFTDQTFSCVCVCGVTKMSRFFPIDT